MTKKQIQKIVASLAGQYLLPQDFRFTDLKADTADMLIFKEWLDMKFNANFDADRILTLKNTSEVVDYIYSTLQDKLLSKSDIHVKLKVDAEDNLPDDIGFLLIDLSANDTKKIAWKDVSEEVISLFSKLYKEHNIDYREADIVGNPKKKIYISSFADADADYSSTYVVFNLRVVFQFEN